MFLTPGSRARPRIYRPSGRELLLRDRTLYVSPAGSDYNNGLSPATPFATIQRAWDFACERYDLDGNTLTFQLADGTHTAGLATKQQPVGSRGYDGLVIQGNAATPANCLLHTTSASCFELGAAAVAGEGNVQVTIKNMELRTTTLGGGLVATGNAVYINFANLRFGAIANYQIYSSFNAFITTVNNYAIVGSAQWHWLAVIGGIIRAEGVTVTLTGTPNFSFYFAWARAHGIISATLDTFSGSATGQRYQIDGNGLINTGGEATTYFPGNVAGAAASGGQYI